MTEPILKEAGIEINEWEMVANGKTVSWGAAGSVQVVNAGLWFGKKKYELRISKKGEGIQVMFTTEDGGLAERIKSAIGEVAQRRGAKREI